MPYPNWAPAIQGLLRAFITENFAAQGEAPASLPDVTSQEQAVQMPADLPLTALSWKLTTHDEETTNVGGKRRELAVTVSHLRALDPAGEAAATAFQRLTALQAALEGDSHLATVNQGAPAVERVLVREVDAGEGNALQRALAMYDQAASMAGATLSLTVHWVEYPN